MKFNTGLILWALSAAAQAGGSVMEVIPLQNRPASELQPLLAPLLESGDQVVDNGSSLIVKTTPARLEAIQSLIKQLDTRLNNLTISVLQSSSKTANELNAEAGIAASPSGIQMQGIMADTRDLRSNQAVQQLRTLEGQAAHIATGQARPVQNYNVYGSPNGYPVISGNTQMVEASTGFAVIPRLSGRQVILDIEPWSERFQRGGQIETQGARTSIRVNLGEWVEIGGVEELQQVQGGGYGGFNQSVGKNTLRLLIKVDKAD